MLEYRQVRTLFVKAGFAPSNAARRDDVSLSDQNLLELAEDFRSDTLVKRPIDDGCSLRVSNEWERTWLGDRLIFRPSFPRFTRFAAYFSSRLGSRLDQQDNWFAALRTLLLRSSTREETLITCQQTASGPYCRRAAELFGKCCYDVIVSDDEDMTEWLNGVLNAHQPYAIYVSPKFESSKSIAPKIERIPLGDRVLVALANRYVGLHVRKNGNVHRLFRLLVDDDSVDAFNVQLVAGNALVPSEIFNELTAYGAIGRFHWSSRTGSSESDSDTSSETEKASIIPMPAQKNWSYLSHWTRRAKREWPDQDRAEFLDELILGCDTKDRSSFAALTRILLRRVILATKGSNRSGSPTVSFTEVPLHDWAQRRTFRHHRTRWDFEPYGISVSRQWLENNGARAVIYGSNDARSGMPDADLPFFQIQKSKSADWTAEKEWRFIGDLSLDQIPTDRAFAFVSSRNEAELLASVSPFPIVVMNEIS